MADYIEREEIYRRWNAMPAPASVASLSAAISQTSSADVAPVRHGKWEIYKYATGFVHCSVCRDVYIDEEWITDSKWNYCPNCGARMDGGEPDA